MYDPTTGLFPRLENSVRSCSGISSADLLSDGRVLITGGVGENGIQTEARRTAFTVKPRELRPGNRI